jgi:hypothetical protein
VRWFNFGVGEEQQAGGAVKLVGHPDQVWYRLSLDAVEPWKKIDLVRQPGAAETGIISDPAFDLHTGALTLLPEKVADLAKFKAWLPREFHSLYPDPAPAPPASDEDEEEEEAEEEDEDEEEAEEEAEDEEDAGPEAGGDARGSEPLKEEEEEEEQSEVDLAIEE